MRTQTYTRGWICPVIVMTRVHLWYKSTASCGLAKTENPELTYKKGHRGTCIEYKKAFSGRVSAPDLAGRVYSVTPYLLAGGDWRGGWLPPFQQPREFDHGTSTVAECDKKA